VAWHNLGDVLKVKGDWMNPSRRYGCAAAKPAMRHPTRNLVFTLHFSGCRSKRLPARLRAGMRSTRAPASRQSHTHDRDPRGACAVGYVSPDFSGSLLSAQLWPLCAVYMNAGIFCYSDVPLPDALTTLFAPRPIMAEARE